MERHPLTIARALDPGVVRVNRASVWVNGVVTFLEPSCNAAGRRTLAAFAHALLTTCEGTSRTTRGTWARWAQMIGRSPRTIARWIARLRVAGWLRTVASGRHGRWAPNSNEGSNDAPVYALTCPRGWSPGDGSVTPPRGEPSVTPHAHPSTPFVDQNEPLRGTEPHQGAASPPIGQPVVNRPGPKWPGHATTKRLDDMSLAAAELRRRLPVLGPLRVTAIRHQLVRFLRAGWTVVDLAWAIDHRPDGTPWPHDGATGVRSPRGWLAHRLRDWRDPAGEPVRSRSQLAAAERARERAITEARRTRALLDQAELVAERAQLGDQGPGRRQIRDLLATLPHPRRR